MKLYCQIQCCDNLFVVELMWSLYLETCIELIQTAVDEEHSIHVSTSLQFVSVLIRSAREYINISLVLCTDTASVH